MFYFSPLLFFILNLKTISLDEIFKTIIISYYDDKKKYEELIKWCDNQFLLELFNSYFGSSMENFDEIELLFKSLIFSYFASDRYIFFIFNASCAIISLLSQIIVGSTCISISA